MHQHIITAHIRRMTQIIHQHVNKWIKYGINVELTVNTKLCPIWKSHPDQIQNLCSDLSSHCKHEGHPKSFHPRHIRQQYFPQPIHQWNVHPLRTLMNRLRIWCHCNLWRHTALNTTDFQHHEKGLSHSSSWIADTIIVKFQISKQIIVTEGKVVAVCRVVLV